MQVPIEISARHVHLSREDLRILFGKNYQLKPLKKLSQPGLFAAYETVILSTPLASIEKVRIIGPEREKIQVEISQTDAVNLGINPPFRISGDLKNSEKLKLIGPQGEIDLREGVIIARRHLHLSREEANQYHLKDGDIVSVKINGERELVFHQVVARVQPNFKWSVHLDTDEANAAGINSTNKTGEVIFS